MQYKKLEFSDRTVWLEKDNRGKVLYSGYQIEKYKTLKYYHLSKDGTLLGKFESLASAIVEAKKLDKPV
jgi:hypothetical protein